MLDTPELNKGYQEFKKSSNVDQKSKDFMFITMKIIQETKGQLKVALKALRNANAVIIMKYEKILKEQESRLSKLQAEKEELIKLNGQLISQQGEINSYLLQVVGNNTADDPKTNKEQIKMSLNPRVVIQDIMKQPGQTKEQSKRSNKQTSEETVKSPTKICKIKTKAALKEISNSKSDTNKLTPSLKAVIASMPDGITDEYIETAVKEVC